MYYSLQICQVALFVVLFLAAAFKILQPNSFFSVLQLFAPNLLTRPIAILFPWLEMIVAIGIVLTSGRLLSAVMTISSLLFAIFMLSTIIMYVQGKRDDCGCFGIIRSEITKTTILQEK